MENNNLKEKLKELLPNPEFGEALKNAGSFDGVLALLRENGIDTNKEELEALFRGEDKLSAELTEEELDDVAGGGFVWDLLTKYLNPGYWISYGVWSKIL